MKLETKNRMMRPMAIAMAGIILSEVCLPTVALALTSGPAQPEFSSFEPVATTNMVNDFSGDLTYNLPVLEIPGASGGGYAMSLSYHSGANAEEEASWVGYGWTLNPGAISRGKRGFPDDDKGTGIVYRNEVPPNQTVSVGAGVGAEAFSMDLPVNLNASLRYNNYKGFGYTAGAGIQLAKGIVSLGFSVSDGEGSFSVRVNPMATLSKALKDQAKDANQQSKQASLASDKKKLARQSAAKQAASNATRGMGAVSLIGSKYGLFSHSEEIRNVSNTQYEGASTNFTVSLLGTPIFIPAGVNVDLSGNFSYQKNKTASRNVYGYMYSSSAPSGGDIMMDYYMEKLNPYDKQDKYLGIPFSNADMFSLSGEGIGGSFRAHHRKAGHFHPNEVTSKITIVNAGAEVEMGTNIGTGMDISGGFQKFSSTKWTSESVNAANFSGSDEPISFRFTGDQGGYVDYGSDAKQQAKVKYKSGGAGNKSYEPSISAITTTSNSDTRNGRSSYIAYHTNSDFSLTEGGKMYKAYSMNEDVNKWVTRTTSGLGDGLGEFAIFNEDGTRYTYGLPVYSRNEMNLQYDLQGAAASAIDNNYIARKNISSNKSKVGEERTKPYASSFLLSEITSSDYVDRTMNGPSDDDYGGYTRFSYERLYGHNDKNNSTSWYRWRLPYNGLLYNRGELSTSLDDMGSVSCGEKEIYYLDTIMTKTHFAVFRLSGTDRADGYGSADNETAANSSSAQDATKKLKKLDRIDLYAKDPVTIANSKLIKSVRFQYDHSLCQGLPNSASGTGGKLTLKKVWFEYEGVYNAKVSPYIFDYSYPTTAYVSKYNGLDSAGTGLTQNPAYSAFDIDPWGNYQSGGATRYSNLQNWVDQTPAASFDPAAWQLKVIKLPSGGEIHIQYEQDDYKYVQDKWAHAMVSLHSATDASDPGNNKYYLNLSDDLGSNADVNTVKKLINDQYVLTGNKMYFKLLYKLLLDPANPSSNPTITSCATDYITGYATVKRCAVENVSGTDRVYVILGSSSSGKHDIPKKVCRNFVTTQRAGNITIGGNCNPDASGVPMNGDPEQVVEKLVSFLATNLIPGNSEICTRIEPSLSYVKIPIPFKAGASDATSLRGKKGGGIRVKRLLMYDKGIETGDAALFGSEYLYQEADGTSSGVATNEPSPIREENALVEFDAKHKQGFLSKIVAGRDKEQAEKPLGESIMPSPSVGYSRVVIKNIHSGKTNPGFVVKEYFTAKNYPVKVDYTPIETERDFLPIPGGLINYFVSNMWLSQGFAFTLNNMHGQPRSETTYSGDYGNMTRASISSQQSFTYFEPGDQIPMMNSLNSITNSNPGKEEELVFETRGVEDISNDLAIEIDLDVGLAFIPIPFFSIIPSYTYNESKMYSHTTTKVINYPAIQKSVLSYADGIYHLSQNLAFNPHTGKPVITRTTDGFDKLNLNLSSNHAGTYTAYSFPASQQYPGMAQKARNERASVNTGTNLTITMNGAGSSANPYYLQFSGSNSCSAMSQFCPGDMLYVKESATAANNDVFHMSDSTVGNKKYIYLLKNYNSSGSSSVRLASYNLDIEILRSGCTNQLNTVAGSFTTYGDTSSTLIPGGGNIADRIWLRDTLNTLIATLNCSTNPTVTLPQNKIRPSLKVACGANCDTLKNVAAGGLVLKCQNGQFFFKDSIVGSCGTSTCSQFLSDQTPVCFALNESYELVFFSASSYPCPSSCTSTTQGGTLLTCLDLCPNIIEDGRKVSVVSADAKTFADRWGYDAYAFNKLSGSNEYENGTKGKWRQQSGFVYRDSVIGANASNQRTYKKAGVFELQTFNWKKSSANDTLKWIKLSTVTKYSPDGNAMEEKDILGIFSAAKFGYEGTQPYLIAKNADYSTTQFDGFEKLYSATKLEDAWTPGTIKRSSNTAHSGKYSWKMSSSDSIPLDTMKVNSQILGSSSGLTMKVWVRDSVGTKSIPIKGSLFATGKYIPVTFTKVARTGEWSLFEAKVSGTTIDATFNASDVIIGRIKNDYSTTPIYIDDVRVQPSDAQMIAYVYDVNTLRLITTFDDQHFGLYYQYNGEGKLLRKQVETEKGLKTITETQYHTPAVLR